MPRIGTPDRTRSYVNIRIRSVTLLAGLQSEPEGSIKCGRRGRRRRLEGTELDADRSIDDAEIAAISSPLCRDARLHALIARFAARAAVLGAASWSDDDATEGHFAEVARVADNLAWRDHEGRLDEWDWAATFLGDESFRDLYDADRHWVFEDGIRDDVNEFLAEDWEAYATHRMTKREIDNLLAVISHHPADSWTSAATRLEELLRA
jgi:hypothetical protein